VVEELKKIVKYEGDRSDGQLEEAEEKVRELEARNRALRQNLLDAIAELKAQEEHSDRIKQIIEFTDAIQTDSETKSQHTQNDYRQLNNKAYLKQPQNEKTYAGRDRYQEKLHQIDETQTENDDILLK
jgi:multidrug resistance efflux pump